MATIEAAFYGDEKSTRNVTDVLKSKVSGNKITVDKVDDSLIPTTTVTRKAEVTTQEMNRIRNTAVKACGGNDSECVKLRTDQLTQETLRAKANDEVTEGVKNIIKGKRLTVRIRDSKGNVTTKVVPENGKLELDGLSIAAPNQTLPPTNYIVKQFTDLANTSIGMFLWVFSVAATYSLFSQMGWGWAAYALAIVAAIVPNSGWIIIFGYFIYQAFMEKYTAV